MSPQFKEYVEKCVNYCRDESFCGMNRIDIRWMARPHEDDSDASFRFFDIRVNSDYYEALLRVYPAAFEEWKDGHYKRLGLSILHEVCHIILDPMHKAMMSDAAPSQIGPFTSILERTTQHLAIALNYQMPKNWWHPSKFGISVDRTKKKR